MQQYRVDEVYMIFSNIIKELKSEHQSFLIKLDRIYKRSLEPNFFESVTHLSYFRTEFLQLNHEVSSQHHEKEERMFATLIGNSSVNQGGPKCDYFMQQRLINEFSNKAEQLWQAYSDLTCEKEALLLQANIQGSALSIPLEEHFYLKKIVLMMSYEVNLQLQEIEEHRSERIGTLFKLYRSMLIDHIEKEDQCLFKMLEKISA